MIFIWHIFPDCYIEGSGLTLFKIISEYIISLILLIAAILIFKFRDNFDTKVLQLMLLAIAASIVSELTFTFDISVYGFSNVEGHLFKIVSFYMIYQAIIKTGIERPHETLYRKISIQKNKLQKNEERFQVLTSRLIEARENECKRISMELHDAMGQSLTAVSFNLNFLHLNMPRLSVDIDLTFLPIFKILNRHIRLNSKVCHQ